MQYLERLGFGDRREIVQELVEVFAALQVIPQRLDWYAGAGEDSGTTQDFRRANDHPGNVGQFAARHVLSSLAANVSEQRGSVNVTLEEIPGNVDGTALLRYIRSQGR